MLDELLRSGGLFDAEFWLRQLWPGRDGSVERVMRHRDVRIDFPRMPQWLFCFTGDRTVEARCSRRKAGLEGSRNESGRLNDDGHSQRWNSDR